MNWFDSVESPKLKNSKKTAANSSTPPGLWTKCTHCGETIQNDRLKESHQVCPYCQHHFRLSASERLELLLDEKSFRPLEEKLATSDPLDFVDKKSYRERLQGAFNKTGQHDGVLAGEGVIKGHPVAIAAMDFGFMGGSMGVVCGEKIALTMDLAYQKKRPAIIVSCSGGARMQEGILSLMQMAKTSSVRQKLKKGRIPFISVLTDPTTGGVAASFAMLGDVNIAEPGALIGFAGPRVIEQSIRQKLPEGFQRSEFLKEHGFIDRIVHRHKLKNEIAFFVAMFGPGK